MMATDEAAAGLDTSLDCDWPEPETHRYYLVRCFTCLHEFLGPPYAPHCWWCTRNRIRYGLTWDGYRRSAD